MNFQRIGLLLILALLSCAIISCDNKDDDSPLQNTIRLWDAFSIIEDVDGNYLIPGTDFGYPEDAVRILKVSPNGLVSGFIPLGIHFSVDCQEIPLLLNETGGITIAYTNRNSSNSELLAEDVLLIKMNSDFSRQWTRSYYYPGFATLTEAALALDGGYWIAGSFPDPVTFKLSCFVLRTDAQGDTLWSGFYGPEYSRVCGGIEVMDDGTLIIIGYWADLWLGVIDDQGSLNESQFIAGAYNYTVTDVVQATDGGLLISGDTDKTTVLEGDFYVMKVSVQGDVLWVYEHSADDEDIAEALLALPDGGCIAVGSVTINPPSYNKPFIVRLNNAGEEVWSKQIPIDEAGEAVAICQASDGGYVIAGNWLAHASEDGSSGVPGVFYTKIDPDGNILWLEHMSVE